MIYNDWGTRNERIALITAWAHPKEKAVIEYKADYWAFQKEFRVAALAWKEKFKDEKEKFFDLFPEHAWIPGGYRYGSLDLA